MKNSLLALSVFTAAFLFSLSANAADPVVEDDYVPVPVVEASSNKFCDAYAGFQAGYVWGDTRSSGPYSDPTMVDMFLQDGKNDGVSGGLYAGCNFRQDVFLWGVEGDINLADIGANDHQNWYGTLRLRAGPTFGNTLLYATGGLAFGQVSMIPYHINMSDQMSIDTPFSAGWTAGAGVEHWFSDKVSWKTEYLYLDLGKATTLRNSIGGTDMVRADWSAHTVRTGIAIHF